MKFKNKMYILIGGLSVVIITSLIIYLNFYLTNLMRTRTAAYFQSLAEFSEGSYYAFLESMKVRAVDWSYDYYLRKMTGKITNLSLAEQERKEVAEELGDYLKQEKMKYDPSVVIVDILDKDGIVVSSSDDGRIGVNEKKEEDEEFDTNYFSSAIISGFNEVFIESVIIHKEESPDPQLHTITRIFSQDLDEQGNFIPLDAAMLVHYANTDQLNDILNGRFQEKHGALTGGALFDHYRTAEIYLVNQHKMMVTPSRFAGDAVLSRTVDTLPVRACLEEDREIIEEYQNYMGKTVLGASVCLGKHDLTLVIEAQPYEVFEPIRRITNQLILSGFIVLILSGIGLRLSAGILTEDLDKLNERANKTLNTLLENSRKEK